MAAEVSDRMGYDDPAATAAAARPHAAPATAAAPPAPGRQLNATETPDIGGPAQAILGRAANFVKGATSSRPGGGGIPGMSLPGMGGAAEGAAGGAAEGAAGAGIGETLAELAPLALA
jgi:hypothetical protein